MDKQLKKKKNHACKYSVLIDNPYQGLGGSPALVSNNFAPSSSIEMPLQSEPEFFRLKSLALSSLFPLKPFIFDDTIGITRTADALIESSPSPNDIEQAVCKKTKVCTVSYLIRQKVIILNSFVH